MDSSQLYFNVADRSYFALLKKDVHALAAEVEFSSERAGRIDIIVAELVSNLVKHGNGGYLIAKKIIDINKALFTESHTRPSMQLFFLLHTRNFVTAH